MRFVDLTGKVFGRLTVIGKAGRNKHGQILWRCSCLCGGKVIIVRQKIVSGHTKSCGCLRSEAAKKRGTTHGMRDTQEYNIWGVMIQRCTNPRNPAWKWYGARGIKVCDKWFEFSEFYKDMGSRPTSKHSIDRIDVNGDYAPGNVRWVLPKDQANNHRNNLILEVDGRLMTLAEAVNITGVNYNTAYYRFKKNWDVERVLTP